MTNKEGRRRPRTIRCRLINPSTPKAPASMPLRFTRAATIALSLLLFANPAPAQAPQAQALVSPAVFISALAHSAAVVLHDGDPSPPARQARFRALIQDKFDLPAIAQAVMGRRSNLSWIRARKRA